MKLYSIYRIFRQTYVTPLRNTEPAERRLLAAKLACAKREGHPVRKCGEVRNY
jgi:hypothetical protein